MATKRLRFDNLTIGTNFNMEVAGLTGAFRKVSTTKAINLRGIADDDASVAEPFKVRAGEVVTVQIPDPTPAELAEQRLQILNYRLDDMLSTSRRAQREMAELMAKENGWYSVFANSGQIEGQMKAAAYCHIATCAKKILEHPEGGIKELTETACRNAMRYARFGSHSTSAVSNVAEEMQAAAWAEIAEACGWDRTK